MQFVMTGFTQDNGFRVFAFERISTDRKRTPFTVSADMDLVRQYGIRVQELPLLCVALLEEQLEGDETRAWTYTEEAMQAYATSSKARILAAANKKKPPRRPMVENPGSAWRKPVL